MTTETNFVFVTPDTNRDRPLRVVGYVTPDLVLPDYLDDLRARMYPDAYIVRQVIEYQDVTPEEVEAERYEYPDSVQGLSRTIRTVRR